jgi:chromosomal replication initiation ATPase DnaA
VIDYVARRMERSLGAARETVAALDEEALALGRRVTKPVAAAVLARLTSDVD